MKKYDRKNLFYPQIRKFLGINGPSDLDIKHLNENVIKFNLQFIIDTLLFIITIGVVGSSIDILDYPFKAILLGVYVILTLLVSYGLIEAVIIRVEYHKIIKHLKQKENNKNRENDR